MGKVGLSLLSYQMKLLTKRTLQEDLNVVNSRPSNGQTFNRQP